MRGTVVLLAGGLALVAAGTAGVTGSLALVLALGSLGCTLWLAGDTLIDDPSSEFGPRTVARDIWVGPFLAAAVVGFHLGASAGEVQALGGLVGLAGMVNYFLRPFYHLLYGLARRAGVR